MVLDSGTLFGTAEDSENEFFISEAEKALRRRLVVKESDQENTTTTLVDDNELFFDNIESNSIYEFEVTILLDNGPSGGAGAKWTMSGPAESEGRHWKIADDSSIETGFDPEVFGTTERTSNDAIRDDWYQIKGWIKTGNIAGTLQFKWAQRLGGSGVRLKALSWMRIDKQ